MRADQGRIRDILKETILALLNNGVEFTSELEVDGLLGVTIDKKDVFLVKISEVVASQRRHAGGDKESSDEDAGTGSSSKGRKKRRSPSPKNKGEKRQRVASPTQSIPSSSTSHKADNAKAEKAQVNIDLTSVKSEPVDTTVSDSNHSMGDMSDVGPSFDYNQQQPHITSIQAVAQTPDAESAQGTWSQHHQSVTSQQQAHAETKIPNNKRKRCRVCYRLGFRRDVQNMCADCPDRPPLCGPHFIEYHVQLGIPTIKDTLRGTNIVDGSQKCSSHCNAEYCTSENCCHNELRSKKSEMSLMKVAYNQASTSEYFCASNFQGSDGVKSENHVNFTNHEAIDLSRSSSNCE